MAQGKLLNPTEAPSAPPQSPCHQPQALSLTVPQSSPWLRGDPRKKSRGRQERRGL